MVVIKDVFRSPGVTSGIDGIPDGLHYDVIQRNIRGNHVALVDKGRAGETACLRMDSADAFQIEDEVHQDRDPSTIQTLIFDPKKFTPAQAKKWAKDASYEC